MDNKMVCRSVGNGVEVERSLRVGRRSPFGTVSPTLLYHSYPGSDLIPIEPPTEMETMRQFAERLADCGDTLFLFLARELSDLAEDDTEAIVDCLEGAIAQIESVIDAVQQR